MWHYPPFEPRLWILYEVAEFTLTGEGGLEMANTPDIRIFRDHVREVLALGVQCTLAKYGYRCTYERDMTSIISWLECLVLLTNLNVPLPDIRKLLDLLTWTRTAKQVVLPSRVELSPYDGTLKLLPNGKLHMFTPFPPLVSGPSTIILGFRLRFSHRKRIILWRIREMRSKESEVVVSGSTICMGQSSSVAVAVTPYPL
jgi:hypothetical protein